ncbi:MAG: LPS export ABC transporter permease LptF [Desulfobacterales bacterium]
MILQRYLALEILKPTGAILFVLVLIFASYTAVTYLAQAVAGSLPLATVGILILLRIGMALEVLLPVTLYLAVIIALGRMYKDAEMTALAACGVGPAEILRAVFRLALPLAALSALASLFIRPEAYVNIYRIQDEAQARFDISRLEADHFLSMQNGRIVFFAERVEGRGGGAHEVFIRIEEGESRRVIRAERMTQTGPDRLGTRRLSFRDGAVYEFHPRETGGRVGRFAEAEYPMPQEDPDTGRYRRKAAPTGSLLGSPRLEDIAELQWRLSTPVSTILLALLGVPLARSNPRRGKYARLGTAIVIFAFYYQGFVVAKTWVEKAIVPPLPGIAWVPALLGLLLIGLLLRLRRGVIYG